MNVVADEMRKLVRKEYEAANAAHGPLASMHEGWAVALEEIQEAQEAMDEAKRHFDEVWSYIREDRFASAAIEMKRTRDAAIQCACEAVQVASVCKRFMDLEKK